MSETVKPAILLYVVTDHADHAAIDVFARDPACIPSWARIITRAQDFTAIPTGAKVLTRFYGPRRLFEDLWVEERVARCFDIDFCAHMEAMKRWRARDAAGDAAKGSADGGQDMPAEEAVAVSDNQTSRKSRKSRWT